MTLKNWKKIPLSLLENTYGSPYEEPYNEAFVGYENVGTSQVVWAWKVIRGMGKGTIGVELPDESEYFDTKAQANKFIKEYMEKH